MLPFEDALRGRRVLVTGHTGFTGAWLCQWLLEIGANVSGLALPPEGGSSLFDLLGLAARVDHAVVDIRDAVATRARVAAVAPKLVIHLAAQPLVRRAYADPEETFAVNVLGTVNVLEACRHTPSVRAVVAITTDKVYENKETGQAYRETDPLGGKDPYSASKAAAELVIASYQQTLNPLARDGKPPLRLAAARGGNIIGGGDWAADRLVPDFARAAGSNQRLTVRNPDAVRPWQHVLGLCHGYLMLSAMLLEQAAPADAGAWNFGPQGEAPRTVREVLDALSTRWRDPGIDYVPSPIPEAGLLSLDSGKASERLRWAPPWNLDETLARTADWYKAWYQTPERIREVTDAQLSDYRAGLANR